MTQERRIALNIVATYGRSPYALVIGLFCGGNVRFEINVAA